MVSPRMKRATGRVYRIVVALTAAIGPNLDFFGLVGGLQPGSG